MKGGNPHLAAVDAQEGLDSRTHLFGGLVCEGDGQNTVRCANLAADQVCDPVGDDAGLPRSRASENERGSLCVENSFLLFRIETCEENHCSRRTPTILP